MKIKFLGTGTSHGVPVPGCNCNTCKSSDPRNNRFRSSIYVEWEDKSCLIDTPPEHRLQMVKWGAPKPDIILFTHGHADHIMGFDDIRSLNWRKNGEITCYCNQETEARIREAFSYIFAEQGTKGGGLPQAKIKNISMLPEPWENLITPLPVKHGKMDVLGYKIGSAAYLTDVSKIPETTRKLLTDIELLILGVLRKRQHPTHLSLAEGIEIADDLNANRNYFVHMSHDLEYQTINKALPEHIDLAFDGLSVKV